MTGLIIYLILVIMYSAILQYGINTKNTLWLIQGGFGMTAMLIAALMLPE